MKTIKYLSTMLLLVASVSLASCAKSPAPTVPSTPQAPATSPAERQAKLVEGATKEGKLVIWTYNMRKKENVLAPFVAKYPGITVDVWDSRGAEIVAKLVEERKVGRYTPDVLILTTEMAEVQEMGALEEYEWPNAQGWASQPNHNFYRNVWGNTRIIPYNTKNVAPADVPKIWDDLKSTKWAGRTAMSTSGEDTTLFWAYLWRVGDTLNWEKSEAFWGEVIKNVKPRVESGFTGPNELLSAGDFDILMPSASSSTITLMRKGANIDIAPLKEGTQEPASMALMKNAPHPNAARLFLDLYTTADALAIYIDDLNALPFPGGAVPMEKTYAGKKVADLGMKLQVIPPGITTNTANLKRASDFWQKALGVK